MNCPECKNESKKFGKDRKGNHDKGGAKFSTLRRPDARVLGQKIRESRPEPVEIQRIAKPLSEQAISS